MSEDTVHRRLSAIMFTDLCGYSRIMGEDEARGMRILARYDEILNSAVTRFGGNIIKRIGDGMLIEFRSAVAAVECAMAIQRDIAEKNGAAAETDQFQVRIGVHLGDVVVADGDILGDGVNVASRIEPLATPGGICISQDIYNQVQNKVEMQVVSLGPQQLKNIQRQVEIYRVIVAAADETAPLEPAPAASSAPGRRGWLWAVLAVVLLLLAGAAGTSALKRAWDQKRLAQAVREADALLKQKEAAKAVARLESALQKARPNTKGADGARELLAKAKDLVLTDHLRARFDALTETLLKKDWDGAAQFADPESKMRLGIKNISGRLSVVGFFAGLLRVKSEDYRIREIKLSNDRQSAEVIPELRVGGNWTVQKAATWKRVNGEWFLVVE